MADEKKIQQTSPGIKLFTFFSNYSNYRIAAAIRGPDFEAPCLKRIFTERLRAPVIPPSFPPFLRTNPDILPGDLRGALEETVKQCKQNPFGLYHYLTHILSALTILWEEGILQEEEYNCLMWLANFLLRTLNLYTCKFVDETEINLMALNAEQYVKQFAENKYVADGEAAAKIMRNVLKSAKRYALKRLKKQGR